MKAVIETFKPVKGYEGLYEVSDYGAVRSLQFKGKKRIKYLNGRDSFGYRQVHLSNGKSHKMIFVHRIVYEAFNSPIPYGYEIDHIDGDRNNNKLSNLRVVTHRDNMNNPVTILRKSKSRCKPILQLNKQTGEVIRQWECARDAWREIGINFKNISQCCLGNRKSAGGFRWCFA